MIIAIDFDNTIHDAKNPIQGRRMGAPLPGAKEALSEFHRAGDEIIVFSTWADEKRGLTIKEWLEFYEIPFDSLTNVKPQADVYIDDKAVRYTTWPETLEIIKHLNDNL